MKTFNQAEELQKFVERGGKYEETAPNVYKLTYTTGETRVFNFSTTPKRTNFAANIDTTIINVWEIDTLLYYQKFSFWQKVNIVNDIEGKVFVDDINNNGKLELYGLTRVNWPFGGQVDILEQDDLGIFHRIHSYDSTSSFVQGMGDVDSDGIKEIHLRTTDTLNGKYYKADSLGALPTTFDFIFYYAPHSQFNDMTFGDFDDNGITDCVFLEGAGFHKCVIAEYRDSVNNFTQLFEFTGSNPGDFSGFAIGDFDLDRKTELVFGGTLQEMNIIEVENENQYSVVYQGFAPTYNAYLITTTNDIDKNGKPEFWVGGQDFNEGVSKLMCYEANSDNSYSAVAYIELRYLVSLRTNYLQASDINGDGKEELVINLGNHLLILEFTGEPNNHNYGLFYVKIEEGTQIGANFQHVTISDFNRDGMQDILLPMNKYVNPITLVFSHLLVQKPPSSINDISSSLQTSYSIEQNFPNPFNNSSTLKINCKSNTNITLKVYNLLGKEIRTLLEDEFSSGEYTIQWDGKDSMGHVLNSGIYFVQMKANGFTKTIKTILLK